MSKSSDKFVVDTEFPDDVAELLKRATPEELDLLFKTVGQVQDASERETEAWLRKWTAYGLWGTAVVVLAVSVGLIVGQAFAVTHLPEAAITALIASVPAEFVGMFYFVVRYLFSQGGR